MQSIKQPTINSGNTFGAKFWTDGKQEAPMLPDQPWLVMCPHCHAPLWIDELEELGQIEPWGDEKCDFNDAHDFIVPTLDDYFTLIANGVSDREKARYARLRAWWAGNDERRRSQVEIPMSAGETENVAAFMIMLDESDANDLVVKAEAMRELGRFEESLSLLEKSDDKNFAKAVEIIKRLSEKRDPYVRQLVFN